MAVSIEIIGLNELIKECERLSTTRELEQADKKALNRIGISAQREVSRVMPRSKDVTKSGRKGSRTFKHSGDNVPVKVKKQDGRLIVVVGWDKGDISPYFYTKFIEWGTSKLAPKAPFKKTFIKKRGEHIKIFMEEYEKLVEKLS